METEKYAARLLRAIGMSPKYKGYAYILYILTLAIEDTSLTHNISSQLYSLVCDKYHVHSHIVERNIRFAIKRTWEAQNSAKMHQLFQIYGIDYVPTNREFICIMTDCAAHKSFPAPTQLRMW